MTVGGADREGGGGRAPRRRMSPEDRRSALIAAALDLFNTRPYDDVSVDDLAEAAGMSRPLLYHYYGSKFGVFLAALRQAAGRLVTVVEEAATADPDQWLLVGLRAYLGYVADNPINFTALVRHGHGPGEGEDQAMLDEVRRRFLELILTALDLRDAPPLLLTTIRGWISFVETFCRDWLAGGGTEDPEYFLRSVFAAVLRTAAETDEDVRRALLGCGVGLRGAGIERL